MSPPGAPTGHDAGGKRFISHLQAPLPAAITWGCRLRSRERPGPVVALRPGRPALWSGPAPRAGRSGACHARSATVDSAPQRIDGRPSAIPDPDRPSPCHWRRFETARHRRIAAQVVVSRAVVARKSGQARHRCPARQCHAPVRTPGALRRAGPPSGPTGRIAITGRQGAASPRSCERTCLEPDLPRMGEESKKKPGSRSCRVASAREGRDRAGLGIRRISDAWRPWSPARSPSRRRPAPSPWRPRAATWQAGRWLRWS